LDSLNLLEILGMCGWNAFDEQEQREVFLRLSCEANLSMNGLRLSRLSMLYKTLVILIGTAESINEFCVSVGLSMAVSCVSLPLNLPDPVQVSRAYAMNLIRTLLARDVKIGRIIPAPKRLICLRGNLKNMGLLQSGILIDSLWIQNLYLDCMFVLHAASCDDEEGDLPLASAVVTIVMSLNPSPWFYTNLSIIVDILELNIPEGKMPSELVRIILTRLVALLKLKSKKGKGSEDVTARQETLTRFVSYYTKRYIIPNKNTEAISLVVNLLQEGPENLRASGLELLVELLKPVEVRKCCPTWLLDSALDVALEMFKVNQLPQAIGVMEILQNDAAERDGQSIAFPFIKSESGIQSTRNKRENGYKRLIESLKQTRDTLRSQVAERLRLLMNNK